MQFAKDYTEYVSIYGVVSAKGIELTGITSIERLNVVNVTRKEKILNTNIPDNMYVVENIAYEGILFLQDQTGAVYFIAPYRKPKKVYNSLAEYIKGM